MNDAIPRCSRCDDLLKDTDFRIECNGAPCRSVPAQLRLCSSCVDSFGRWYRKRKKSLSAPKPRVPAQVGSALPRVSGTTTSMRRHLQKQTRRLLVFIWGIIFAVLAMFYWSWTIVKSRRESPNRSFGANIPAASCVQQLPDSSATAVIPVEPERGPVSSIGPIWHAGEKRAFGFDSFPLVCGLVSGPVSIDGVRGVTEAHENVNLKAPGSTPVEHPHRFAGTEAFDDAATCSSHRRLF